MAQQHSGRVKIPVDRIGRPVDKTGIIQYIVVVVYDFLSFLGKKTWGYILTRVCVCGDSYPHVYFTLLR